MGSAARHARAKVWNSRASFSFKRNRGKAMVIPRPPRSEIGDATRASDPMMMPLHPTWGDIVLRLVLTMVAGALMGFNREARGHAAGLRTTILVTLAASIAMIQANILLSLGGKQPDSFAVMDLMRLPLGILTGVGFIGGGAILKRNGAVSGVTTAATLWIATTIGLCFGGGQIALGVISTALGILTLWAMEWIDRRIPREHRAILVVATAPGAPTPSLSALLKPLGYSARLREQRRSVGPQNEDEIETQFHLAWKQVESVDPHLDLLAVVSRTCRVKSFELISGGGH
jgi:putative Mg2+ transporter-C (MgtC) family protein